MGLGGIKKRVEKEKKGGRERKEEGDMEREEKVMGEK